MDREMYVGDTYPGLAFSIALGDSVVDLTKANSVTLYATGSENAFSGPATAMWPPQTDPSQTDTVVVVVGSANPGTQYNLGYALTPSDTAAPDTFSFYCVVEWPEGQQTIDCGDTLTVLPTP